MNISNKYIVKSNCYIRHRTNKSQIVLGNTYNTSLNHLTNGNKKTPHFTITRAGDIYQHFDIKYYSIYLDCDFEEQVISIALENVGQLFMKNKEYYDIWNNHYTGDIFEQQWKNCQYWQFICWGDRQESTCRICASDTFPILCNGYYK